MINPKGKRKSSYIQSRDINGNIIYLDPVTGEISRGIEQGTTQQVSYPIKKQQMINQDVQKKHNERIKRGQSVMIRGKEVRITPKQAQVYQSTDRRPQFMKDASKQSYEQDYKQQQVNKAVDQTTTALGNFSNYLLPSTYAGALVDKLESKNSFLGSLVEGNTGLGSVGTNLVFDLASPLVLGKGFSLMTTLGKEAKPMFNKAARAIENYRYPLGRPQIPENFLTIKPQVRTKVGDVEIDNPNLLYHLDRGNRAGAFSNQGAYVEDGFLFPGTPKDASATSYSWWNKGKPFALGVNRQPMTRLMTATEDTPGMIHIKSQDYPIGQWNGKRGFVRNTEYVNPEGVDVSRSTYTLDPNYGWRRVYAEDTPAAEWPLGRTASKITVENAANITPEQWTAAQDAAKAEQLVKVPNKNSLKGFNFNDLPQEKYVYNDKTGKFDIIAPKKEWIKKGENDLVPNYFVSPQEKERLIATGISPEEAQDIMDVRWINSIEALPGKLRNLEKNTFGDAQNINGRAFIRYNSRKGVKASLNDASTTLNTVFHELGGHGSSLNIGYGTQTIPINMKDILMKMYKHNESLRPQLKPFYQAIKDGNFDLAKNLAKDEGIELSSLKGSSGDIDFKNLKNFIEYMEENQEYSARAIGSNMSNHYRIPNGWNEKQLRDIFTKESVDNLLKNVWNYGIPITVGGASTAILYPSTGLNYYKDGGNLSKKNLQKTFGGKMNTLQLLKNGSGIHIKKENKGKFTDYCGGKVTSECISKGKHSSNPAIRKRATFADNARHFKHRFGGEVLKAQVGTKMTPAEQLAKGWYDAIIGGFIKGKKAFKDTLSLAVKAITPKTPSIYKNDFSGAGSGGRWKQGYKPKNINSFNDAFDEAVSVGAKTFWFGDKLYNTLREANPTREQNNRYVGAGRTEEIVRKRDGYGKDYGPIQTTLAGEQYAIKYQQGGFMSKVGNFLNSDYGKSIVNLGQQLYSGISDASNKIKQNEELQKWKQSFINSQSLSDAERRKFYIQSVQNQQMNNGNVSDIVASHDAWKLEQQELQKRKKAAEMQANQYITQMSLIDNNNQTGGFNFAGMATDILSGVLGNSKTQAITNPSSTYSQFKMPTTNFKVDMKL